MPNYAQHFNPRVTPQSEAASANQVVNSAGGYTFKLDPFKRLERFLILGCEGGTYYATERQLTRENAKCVQECLAADGMRTVGVIVNVSHNGRAAKNDAAIFALALAAADSNPATRAEALGALPLVCRIGTHLFQFVQTVQEFRGWGKSLKRGVANWYASLSPEKLAYQIAKYQQRNGMSHRDVLRLSHAVPPTPEHASIYRYVVVGAGAQQARTVQPKRGSKQRERLYPSVPAIPEYLDAFEALKSCKAAATACALIEQYHFTHEMIPTELKSNPQVWETLLPNMPLHALTHNLATMTRIGLLAPMSATTQLACAKFTPENIKRSRLHPVSILGAMLTYKQGHGEKSKHTWTPVREIIDCLDAAFYASFETLEPSGAKTLLAFDVSGSMDSGIIAGMPGLTPRVAAAAMGMVTARVEPNWHAIAFTAGMRGEARVSYGGNTRARPTWMSGDVVGCYPLQISPRQRLDDICKDMAYLPMGATDCAAPMLYALGSKLEVDTFIVYTDNETWAGAIQPHQALEQYRREMNKPNAKLVVVGMTATDFTIANPEDPGMLDVVGFDTSAPALIAEFSKVAK